MTTFIIKINVKYLEFKDTGIKGVLMKGAYIKLSMSGKLNQNPSLQLCGFVKIRSMKTKSL